MTVIITSLEDFTLEACHRVAWKAENVLLSEKAMNAMAAAREHFMSLIASPDITIYGVTSGYGQNAKKRLSAEERKKHAKVPPVAATTSWGDAVPQRVARAIVFARLANFIEGHAAVSPSLARAVAHMLDGGPLPAVHARGQGGAGEIMSLSGLFLDVARTVDVGEKDVLSLINGSPAATGLVADAALSSARRVELAAKVLAFAAEAFNTPLTHFSPALEVLWNNPYDTWALRSLRDCIGEGHGGERRPYQAPVSFRIMPRQLGLVRRASVTAEDVARESLGAVTDNPVVLPPDDDHPHGQAISTGGYHNPYVPMALDMLTASYTNLTVIAERMAAKMLDGPISLLPPQLGAEEGRSYLGCIPMALTGYEEEARLLAQPTLLPGSESGGFGQNDVASPVFAAWTKQNKVGELLDQSLASLAAVSARAYEVTGRPVPPKLARIAHDVAFCIPDLGAFEPIGHQIAQLAAHWQTDIYES